MMRTFSRFSLFVILSIFAAGGLCYAKVVDKTVATVNGEAIMLSDYQKVMDPVMEQYKAVTPAAEQTKEKVADLKKKILDQMIDDKILKQEAEKRKIHVTKRDIDDGIEQVRKRFPNEGEFQQELRKENITMEDFEKRIREQIMVMKMTESEIKSKVDKPNEASIKEFFEKIKQKMDGKNLGLAKEDEEELAKLAKFFSKATAEQVRARHILITVDKDASLKDKTAALNKAKEAKKKIDQGEDFAKVAQEYSQDTVSAKRGGDLGFFSRGDMVPEFEKVAFEMKVGEVSSPVLTEFGYHIIKVEEHKASRSVSFDDVKDDLQQYMFQKEAQKRYEKWLKDLRAGAKIQVYDLE